MFALRALFALALLLGATGAHAEIRIGAILSLTGPGASLGIPSRQTIEIWPREIGGQPITVTILDDKSDPTAATIAARKLVSEQKVDVIVGPSLTSSALAIMQVAEETSTPVFTISAGTAIVQPMTGPRRWMFKLPPSEEIMLRNVLKHMQQNNQKTLAIVAIASALGQAFVDIAPKIASEYGVSVVGVERFNPTDTSFTAQAFKITGLKPDATLIAAVGTPAVMPQAELRTRGYKGTIFQTQAVANNDFLRVGGKAVEGTLLSATPVLVGEQLPDSNPIKAVSVAYLKAYEGKYGPGSRSLSGNVTWDAYLFLDKAIPLAMAKAAPGTPEFRTALRDALETMKDMVVTSGVYSMSPADHNGADERSQVMVQIVDGKWKYVPTK